jgi:zinc transport system ATP-binding protein
LAIGLDDAIELNSVTVQREGIAVVEGVTASIPKNSVTAVIGPNGAGKTTLLLAILGLIPHQGRIVIHPRKGTGRAKLGYVPQLLDFDRGCPVTVLDFLVMSRQRLPLWLGVRKTHRARAQACLARVQADHLIGRELGRLSGGELQRVQLALALQSDPDVLLLDEPVSGVDLVGERLFCDLLEQIQRESKLTMLLVSHDLSVVTRHATHVLLINRRLQCCGPTPTVMTNENLLRIYGPHMGLYEHEPHQLHAGGCSHGHLHSHDHLHAPGAKER